MKQFLQILVFIISPVFLYAQNISVKSFRKLPNDMTARIDAPKKDQNGDVCAIIKIVTSQKGFIWEPDGLGIISAEPKGGEYWIYLPFGAKRLTIKHEQLGILRDYLYPIPIEKATVYEMVLTTGEVVTTIKDNTVATQFVVITSNPDGADVFINDQHKGQTPFQMEMAEGEYNYRVTKSLYYPEAGKFILKAADETKTMDFVLKPNYGFAEIITRPENGMSVIIDGTLIDKVTPFTSERILSGKHRITVNKVFFHEQTKEITITDNQTLKVEFDVKPAFGAIIVDSKPESGAVVILDDKETAKVTPCRLERLLSGEHTVSIRKEWYEPRTIKVQVTDGKEVNLPVDLKATFGTVKLITDPESEILVDNISRGKGGWEGRMIAGFHTIEAKKDKHHPVIQKLELFVGDVKEIPLEPKPMYGKLKVVTNVIGANIKLNGKEFGTTPKLISDLLIGDYFLTIEKQGYGTLNKTITINSNLTTDLNETLITGIPITFNSDPLGAYLTIDGKAVGSTPQTTTLVFGNHKIKIVNGMNQIDETIYITPGGENIYNYDLRQVAEITIISYPSNSMVYLNGEYKGKTPLVTKTHVGKYSIKISKNTDYNDLVQEINVYGNSTFTYNLKESSLRVSERKAFLNKMYVKKKNQKFYRFTESAFYKSRSIMYYYRDNISYLKLPALYKNSLFFNDLSSESKRGSFYFGISFLEDTQISFSSSYYIDIFSLNLGCMMYSLSHKTRFFIEGKLCYGLDADFKTRYYNGQEVYLIESESAIYYDFIGSANSAGAIGNFKCSFEQNIGGKTFLVISFGTMLYAENAGMNSADETASWFYLSDLEAGIYNNPIKGPNLPTFRWDKPSSTYVGVGIRF